MKYQKLTPNLVVRDVAASVNFYCTVLGFQPGMKVPDAPPYVFASVVKDNVEIFFNDHKAVEADYPALVSRPLGGTMTLYIEVEGLEEILHDVEKARAKITMPLKTQFYGIREFAFEDVDGWVITIAERASRKLRDAGRFPSCVAKLNNLSNSWCPELDPAFAGPQITTCTALSSFLGFPLSPAYLLGLRNALAGRNRQVPAWP